MMAGKASTSSRRVLKRLAAALAVVGLALVVWSVWDHRALMAWIERTRPLPFFSLMAILPAIGVPVTPLFVLAGARFGITIGMVGSLIALAANLAGCYWIARRMRPFFESLLRRFSFRLPNIEKSGKSRIRFVMAVKFAPAVPAFVKHYALGLAGVPFGIYLGLSMLITGVYAVLLVALGESLLDHKIDRAVWVALAALALVLFAWWRSRRKRA